MCQMREKPQVAFGEDKCAPTMCKIRVNPQGACGEEEIAPLKCPRYRKYAIHFLISRAADGTNEENWVIKGIVVVIQ